ncbi:putative Na+/H+ antiporter [Akkermansiaceae bacterium]|nr:putative Na+/H+ antiporter [Akkermansiaceae bacterium]MDA7888133.1 putative Na+/H+ antiporter [Akkermansiaceae bacterium]
MKHLLSIHLLLALFVATFSLSSAEAASAENAAYSAEEYQLARDQQAVFPMPLSEYDKEEAKDWTIMEKLKHRAGQQGGFNLVATIIFLCAIFHTFLSGFFIEMAHKHEKKHKKRIEELGLTAEAKPHHDAKDHVSFKASLFHFLGEVEAIFGIWVIALAGAVLWFFGIQGDGIGAGLTQFKYYIGHDVNFTEPIFVVIIMAIAATRPVVRFAEYIVDKIAKLFGGTPASWWFSALTVTPLLGSFITEPAAMTIAAFLLAKKFFDLNPSPKFAYATLGLLFVNISVGGTLTQFAAPPVLMIASKWSFGMSYMFLNFGWKAALGILIANTAYFLYFKNQFSDLKSNTNRDMHLPVRWVDREDPIPTWITVMHLLFLAWTVYFAHYPALFIGGFLFFLGFSQATGHHQNEVNMKSPILVGFFLAGLVIHGGCQGWWISVLLTSIDNQWVLMIGSTILTAFNDNAAITYLASQAPGLSIGAKYAVLAGAVTGGGLTVIANAPNPAGQSILGRYFKGGVSPMRLAKAALIPTIIMGACFMLIPSSGMTKDPAHPVEVIAEPADADTDPKDQ